MTEEPAKRKDWAIFLSIKPKVQVKQGSNAILMNPCPRSFCSEPGNESRARHDADVGGGDEETRAHWLGVLEVWT